MGEGQFVPFPESEPAFVHWDVLSHVTGEGPQTGLHKPYSSVLVPPLNKRAKKGAETPLLDQAATSASYTHPTPSSPSKYLVLLPSSVSLPLPAASQSLHSMRQGMLSPTQNRVYLVWNLRNRLNRAPHFPLHPPWRLLLHWQLPFGLREKPWSPQPPHQLGPTLWDRSTLLPTLLPRICLLTMMEAAVSVLRQ